jgi:hypothetical protein
MAKPILFLSLFTAVVMAPLAQAERYLIDPNKADTLRCEDAAFKNETYTQSGPPQNFIFKSADGETHALNFRNHQECHTKMQFVKNAQMEVAHPWVQIDTDPLHFAMVDAPAPVFKEETKRSLSSEPRDTHTR